MKRFLWISKESGTQWKWVIGVVTFSTSNFPSKWGEDFVDVAVGVDHNNELHCRKGTYLLHSLYKKIEFPK